MTRRVTSFAAEAAATLRDDAREEIESLFPKMGGVTIGLARDGETVAVHASVKDTTPYSREDVIYCLEGLGVTVNLLPESPSL